MIFPLAYYVAHFVALGVLALAILYLEWKAKKLERQLEQLEEAKD